MNFRNILIFCTHIKFKRKSFIFILNSVKILCTKSNFVQKQDFVQKKDFVPEINFRAREKFSCREEIFVPERNFRATYKNLLFLYSSYILGNSENKNICIHHSKYFEKPKIFSKYFFYLYVEFLLFRFNSVLMVSKIRYG